MTNKGDRQSERQNCSKNTSQRNQIHQKHRQENSNFVKKEILALGNIRNNNKHHLISVCVCVFLGVATLASGLK